MRAVSLIGGGGGLIGMTRDKMGKGVGWVERQEDNEEEGVGSWEGGGETKGERHASFFLTDLAEKYRHVPVC